MTDIKGGKTTTNYTPADSGPTTKKITTLSPLQWESTIALAPYWGSPTISTDPNKKNVTTREYDALGRFVRGWDSGWTRAAHPNTPGVRNTYVYAPGRDAYPYIKTEALHAGGGYRVGYTILDGFLRARQTQSAALDGTARRLVTDSNYDEYGRVATTYEQHVEDGVPGGVYYYEPEWSVPAVNKTTYDLAGRTRETALWASEGDTNLVKKWSTVTAPEGDRTLTTPPSGGTATTVYTDYQGRTTEVRAHNTAAGLDGPYLTTNYTYNRKGQLAKVTDPSKNEWTFTYDIKGRETIRKDPTPAPPPRPTTPTARSRRAPTAQVRCSTTPTTSSAGRPPCATTPPPDCFAPSGSTTRCGRKSRRRACSPRRSATTTTTPAGRTPHTPGKSTSSRRVTRSRAPNTSSRTSKAKG